MKRMLVLSLLGLISYPAAAVLPPKKNAAAVAGVAIDALPTAPAPQRRHRHGHRVKQSPRSFQATEILNYLKKNPAVLGLEKTPDLRVDYVSNVPGTQGLSDRVYVNLVQVVKGIDVVGTGVSFSFNPGLEEVSLDEVHVRLYPELTAVEGGAELYSAKDRLEKRVGSKRLRAMKQKVRFLRGQWRTVQEFSIEGTGLRGAVDGSGQTYVWDDRVYANYTGTVSGRQVTFDPVATGDNLQDVPLPSLKIADGFGPTVFTSSAGYYNFTTPAAGDVTVGLIGRWSEVDDKNDTDLTLKILAGSVNPIDLHFNPSGNIETNTAQVNAYRHTTLIHDWLVLRGVKSTNIDIPIPTAVNINDSCNAYYDFVGINFYKSGNNCINTAMDTVIYHEYGHFVDDKFGGLTDGGLSEGWGDIMSTYVTGQPLVAEGLSFVRNADNTYIYNESEYYPHTKGQAWMGFAWDLRKNLIASLGQSTGVALAESLIIPTIETNSPDIPAAVRAVAVRDDNDGNLSNGTPHFAAIQQAANRHGLAFALETTPPSTPGNVQWSNATNTTLHLSWTASTDNVGVGGYQMDVSTMTTFATKFSYYDNLFVGDVTAWPVDGLTPGSTYYARVRAVDTNQNVSANSAVAKGITLPADVSSPTVTITSPASGATLSNTITLSGTAADNVGVVQVVIFSDGVQLGVASGTQSWSYSLDSWLLGNGTHTLTASAIDGFGNSGTLNRLVNVLNPGGAAYNAALGAPRCVGAAALCLSGPLLNGRGSIAGGAEPNQPNSINGSCFDGNNGTYHADESLDKVNVYTVDGTSFAPGKTVRVEATVWAFTAYSSDALDLYYTANASSPTWTYLTTIVPTGPGSQVLSSTYTLPAGTTLHAVRANFRYNGAPAPCTTGAFDDHDDLIFQVGGADTLPPSIPANVVFSSPTANSLALSWSASTDNVAVTGYRLDVSTMSSFTPFVSGYNNLSVGNVTSRLISGLLSNTTYYARVRAFDAALNVSSNSAVRQAKTLGTDTTPPSAPTGVVFTNPTLTTLLVGWTASTDNVAVTGYRLDVSTTSGFNTFVPGYNNLNVGNAANKLITGLAANKTHYARVRAYDAASNTSFNSATATGTTLAPDTSSPTVAISYPPSGGTVSNAITITGTAADNQALSQVKILLNGVQLGTAAGTTSWSFVFDTWTRANGSYTLAAQAVDTAGLTATSSRTITLSNTANAVFSATLKTPQCTGTSLVSCNSGNLLIGRDSMPGGAEPNQPNTLQGSACADGTSGTYGDRVERIRVYSVDGQALGTNKAARVDATLWKSTSTLSAGVDLFYAANASSPTWVRFATLSPNVSGFQVLSSTYTLPSIGVNQAVRVNFRRGGSIGTCTAGVYDDRDDLVFQVRDATAPSVPTNVIFSTPTASRLNLSWQASTDNVGVTGYRVDVSTANTFSPILPAYNNRNVGNVTALNMTGLSPQTTYYARVRSYDAAGNTSSNSILASRATLADTLPPGGYLYPTGGSIVPGVTTSLQVSANDNVGVTRVEFFVDGVLKATVPAVPYTYRWNTAGLSGSHTLAAKAYDAVGLNVTKTSLVTVSTTVVAAVNAGGGLSIDTGKLYYEPDVFYTAGVSRVVSSTIAIAGTVDPTLYRSQRSSATPFSYAIPLPNGTYTLTLKFADLMSTAAGQNVFKVLSENLTVISSLDVYATSGKFAARDVTFNTVVGDGVLNLTFQPIAGNAFVNALQVKRASGAAVEGTEEPAPTVALTSPEAGATVSGTVDVGALALGVTGVEFYVDGKLKATSSSSPYGFLWDTRQETDGGHVLYAKAFDAQLHTVISTRPVTVANAQASTPITSTGGGLPVNPTSEDTTVSGNRIVSAQANFNGARAYPNPWRSDRHPGRDIIFDRLTDNSTIKIFTISAQWVQTLSAPAGSASWNRTNSNGESVASGVYLYLITDPQGQQIRGKLAIIK